MKSNVPECWLTQTLFTDSRAWSSSFAIPSRLTRSPCAIHSHSAHSCIHSALPGSLHCPARLTQNKRFLFFAAPTPGLRVCRSLQVCTTTCQQRSAGANRARLGAAARAWLPSFFPQVYFSRSPPAKDPELGVRWCRAFAGLKEGMGIPAPHEEMHSSPRRMLSHSHACSRPDGTFRARSLGLTERGSLAGPGPKLTTCLGASMVLRHAWQVSRREPAARAARVCRWRGPSAFFQCLAGVPDWPAPSQALL